MSELRLTPEEIALLEGAEGPGVQRAMEIVVTLGRIYGAPDLVPVTHVQIAGVSYKNLGDAGVAFLNEWAEEGARARVPATLNPAGMELERWQEMGFSPDFARPQMEAIKAFVKMGVTPTMSCTPYLFPAYAPQRGDSLAWAESSAVAWANSVVGAFTNREGGPSALAAAIVGRTARYGYHLPVHRQAPHIIEISRPLRTIADFGALSYMVGKRVGDGVPWFADLAAWLPPLPEDPTIGGDAGDRLKTLGAGLAAYGAVALYHVAGYTPEARDQGEALIRPDAQRIAIDSLAEGYGVMDANPEVTEIDLVTLGCPHASISELRRIAARLKGEKLATRLWITTSQITRARAAQEGLVAIIEAAGGEVVADTCAVVAPVRSLGGRTMATNAGKMANYAPMHSGVKMRYGDMDQCLAAAISGRWEKK
jgi:predicted aconitase